MTEQRVKARASVPELGGMRDYQFIVEASGRICVEREDGSRFSKPWGKDLILRISREARRSQK